MEEKLKREDRSKERKERKNVRGEGLSSLTILTKLNTNMETKKVIGI